MDGPFLCDMGRTIQVRSNGNRIRIGAAGLSSFRPPPNLEDKEKEMGIEITAKIKCDRCGRTQEVPMAGNPTGNRVIVEANRTGTNHWKRLDSDGLEVDDYARCVPKVLCEGCAEAYRDLIREHKTAVDAMFGGADA